MKLNGLRLSVADEAYWTRDYEDDSYNRGFTDVNKAIKFRSNYSKGRLRLPFFIGLYNEIGAFARCFLKK